MAVVFAVIVLAIIGLLQLREPLSEQCEGPYWLMGELVSDE